MAFMFTFAIFICIFMSFDIKLSDAETDEINYKFYDGDYDYGFLEVRDEVFLFWWLYYAGGDKSTASAKPLIIWIQGGPGNPASGMGNFQEIGPQDIYLKDRPSSWVHKRSVLFIDSPVGTGFSYCKGPESFVTNDDELGDLLCMFSGTVKDLVQLMKKFLVKMPEFETIPTHIFSQSYGGKIGPRLAAYLHDEVKAGTMKMNLKSVGIGSGFVSVKSSTKHFAKKVFSAGLVDERDFVSTTKKAELASKLVDMKQYKVANLVMNAMLSTPPGYRDYNLYNMLEDPSVSEVKAIVDFMNVEVRNALDDVMTDKVPGYQYATDLVYYTMAGNMTEPGLIFVEKLLTETDIQVVVYGGQLDLIVPIAASLEWANNLNWHGAQEFRKAKRYPIHGHRNGRYKRFDRLSFWWIYKAGHSVGDNLEAMEHILNLIVDSKYQPTDPWDPRLLW